MNEREKLLKKIKDREIFLKKQRRSCFLWIWLGYAAIIFYVWINIEKHGDLVTCLLIAFCSMFLALFCFVINAAVWTNFTRDINYSVEYLEQLYRELDALDRKTTWNNTRR